MNPFQTIQREEVGTSLKITPQINEGSGVKLTIEQETSSLSGTRRARVDLVTNTRTIRTSVFVNNGEILVLGGMMDDQLRQSESARARPRPDPGLGWLFRARKTDHTKTNLMVFIRPTILRDGEDARFQTSQKYRYMQDLQRQMADDPIRLMRGRASAGNTAVAARAERPLRPRPRKMDSRAMAANLDSRADAPLRRGRAGAGDSADLPFAFAKRNGVLIQELRDGVPQAIYRDRHVAADPRRGAPLRRRPVTFSRSRPETFDGRCRPPTKAAPR